MKDASTRGGAPDPIRQHLKGALNRAVPNRSLLIHGPRDSRAVCLTFDDGPHPVHTPRVLDALAQHGLTATFFLVGEDAQRHPGLVRRIAEEGHRLANHSWSHAPPEQIDAAALVDEVVRTASLIEDLTGTRPTLFRPPHGKLSAAKLVSLWRAQQTVVLWSVDPRDYEEDASVEIRAFLALHPWQGGDIVLLHDVHPHAADCVRLLADAVRARGLHFTTPGAFTGAGPRTERAVP